MAATRTQTQQSQGFKQPTGGAVTVYQPRLAMPPEAATFDIDAQAWRVLVDATFPAARTPQAVMMALAYCRKRNLDPFKRPVHIVPVWSSEKQAEIETVWPGIAELRTTAMRTGAYAGMDAAVWGPDKSASFKSDKGEQFGLTYPDWCQITVYRLVASHRVPFPGPRVYWMETYAHEKKRSEAPNYMWRQRSRQQLEKCAEAAALRRAFPEELGGEYAAEEMEGQTLESVTVQAQHVPTQAAVQQHQEQQQIEGSAVYEVILDGGEVRETGNPAEALALIAGALMTPGADPEGIWESNEQIVATIGAALPEEAETLGTLHIERRIAWLREQAKGGREAAKQAWERLPQPWRVANMPILAEIKAIADGKPAGEASSAPAGGAAGSPGQAVATDDPPAFLWVPTPPKNDKEAEYLAEQIMVRLEPFPGSVRRQWYERNAATYVATSDRLSKMGSPLAAALKAFIEAAS